MAAPHVAGAAALLIAVDPTASPTTLKNAIMNSVDRSSELITKTLSGGRLNVAAALGQLGLTAKLSSPLPDTFVDDRRTTFTVDFSSPIDVSTVQGNDLFVNNLPADLAILLDADTVEFQFNSSPS